jgi:hypothetical protein
MVDPGCIELIRIANATAPVSFHFQIWAKKKPSEDRTLITPNLLTASAKIHPNITFSRVHHG